MRGDFCPIRSLLTCQSWIKEWSVIPWVKGRPSEGPLPSPPVRRRRLHQTNKTAAPLRCISDQVQGGTGSSSALLVISSQWQLRRKSASSALGTGEFSGRVRGVVERQRRWALESAAVVSQRCLLLLASLASRCKQHANTCSTRRTT